MNSPAGSLVHWQQRDRWTAVAILLVCWVLFATVEQRPFTLQGAVVEALVERGRLHFVDGNIKDVTNERVFENLDTKTAAFRELFNIFPYGGRYYVNHAPGQFLLAAPWYALCVHLGWRFETHEPLVWKILVWSLTAPLGALGVMALFVLGRHWEIPWLAAAFASMTVALSSPWWAASGVLYHDSLAITLILLGLVIWQCRSTDNGLGASLCALAAGFLLAFAVVTTYLVLPIVLLICVYLMVSRPTRRSMVCFALAFLPTLSILPISNAMVFGSPFATGYSAGGFDQNFPSPLNLSNAWEKIGFYLWRSEYGLLGSFPVYFLGAIGLTLGAPLKPRVRHMLMLLAAVHFLFIVTMEHHGSVGWGMGRFFLPLYPILALGLPAFFHLAGWPGMVARGLVFCTLFYSVVFAVAATNYGVQGVMTPNVWTLKQRIMADYGDFHQRLVWLALVAGILGEAIFQVFSQGKGAVASGNARASHPRDRQKSKLPVGAASRKPGKKK
ncbi:MAG: hypothetical protein ACXWXZ_06830 [Candidatus Binatia bacterium]